MGSVLLASTCFIVINILADILYGIVDPRVMLK
jgi:ABC-type dipeptide/oligopeptide/nickel transport system permease component